MKSIFIPGIPDVKMRPRATKTGHIYDPNAEKKEASIQKARVSGADKDKVFSGPLTVHYLFVFQRPQGHFGSGKNAGKLKDSAPKHCMNPKDIDNMEKFYADSFNSIHYIDDRQIVESTARKRWAMPGEVPFAQMDIIEID